HGHAPPSLPTSPIPRPLSQGTPVALAYPIPSRLSSTSYSRAAPRYTWLQAARPAAFGAARNSPGGGGLGMLGKARLAGRRIKGLKPSNRSAVGGKSSRGTSTTRRISLGSSPGDKTSPGRRGDGLVFTEDLNAVPAALHHIESILDIYLDSNGAPEQLLNTRRLIPCRVGGRQR